MISDCSQYSCLGSWSFRELAALDDALSRLLCFIRRQHRRRNGSDSWILCLRIPGTDNWHGGLFGLVLMRHRCATSTKPGGPRPLYRSLTTLTIGRKKKVFFSKFMEFEQRPWPEKRCRAATYTHKGAPAPTHAQWNSITSGQRFER